MGMAMPIQKAIRITTFSNKSAAFTLNAKRRITGAGLQGKIIRPKKRPNINAFRYGPLGWNIFGEGITLERSISRIRQKLAPASIKNAIIEIIPIAALTEDRNIQVKMKPTTKNDEIIPAVTTSANRKSNVLSFPSPAWFASQARYPG
jgi:hypothetical protein